MLKTIMTGAALVAVGIVIGSNFSLDAARAQLTPPPGGIKRTILQKVDVPGGTHEVIMGLAEIPGGLASIGRHFHFGSEIGTVLEGGSILMIEGQPDKEIKAGDSYQVGVGIPHDVKNGAAVTKVLAVYVVEKGKPLATPASAK